MSLRLSVIVCTRNRAHALTACLDSIARSIAAAGPVTAEIIVVDNASTDDTPAVIKSWAATCLFPVQALHEAKKGVSAARNTAMRAARGDLLVFTDDDCRLSETHIAETLRHDDGDRDFVLRGGRVELGDKTDLPLTIKTSADTERWSLSMRSAETQNIANTVLGCNMSLRRAALDKTGFFDERLGPGTHIPASEDTDLHFRAYLAGVDLEYVPDMAVYHYHGRKTIPEGKKLLRNYMIGTGALYAKYIFRHPSFCLQYYWDLKDAVREIVRGKNLCMPHVGFSYKDKVVLGLLGAMKYILVRLRLLS